MNIEVGIFIAIFYNISVFCQAHQALEVNLTALLKVTITFHVFFDSFDGIWVHAFSTAFVAVFCYFLIDLSLLAVAKILELVRDHAKLGVISVEDHALTAFHLDLRELELLVFTDRMSSSEVSEECLQNDTLAVLLARAKVYVEDRQQE